MQLSQSIIVNCMSLYLLYLFITLFCKTWFIKVYLHPVLLLLFTLSVRLLMCPYRMYTLHFSLSSLHTNKWLLIYRVIRNDCLGFNNCRHILQIYFYVVKSRIRFMLLLFPQVSRNWRYESETPLKPSPLTCYKHFGTNSIIALMFVESQRVHI